MSRDHLNQTRDEIAALYRFGKLSKDEADEYCRAINQVFYARRQRLACEMTMSLSDAEASAIALRELARFFGPNSTAYRH